MTKKQLHVRVSQHKGRSFRTNSRLIDPQNSKIFDHQLIYDLVIDSNNFKILDQCPPYNLDLFESIHIHTLKPTLNDHTKSTPLYILG